MKRQNPNDIRRPPESESTLPLLTALQFLVLRIVIDRSVEISGREIRFELSERGVKSSGPQFYQLMARLEDSGYVEGWYALKEIENQVVNERRYRITEIGRSAWKKTSDFYTSHTAGAPAPNGSGRKATPGRSKNRKEKVCM
jgi:DNA-binding PadR family transcriptional regulator